MIFTSIHDTPERIFSYLYDYIRVWLSSPSYAKGAQGFDILGKIIDTQPLVNTLAQRPALYNKEMVFMMMP